MSKAGQARSAAYMKTLVDSAVFGGSRCGAIVCVSFSLNPTDPLDHPVIGVGLGVEEGAVGRHLPAGEGDSDYGDGDRTGLGFYDQCAGGFVTATNTTYLAGGHDHNIGITPGAEVGCGFGASWTF
jgi:hypothetical protein